MSFHAVANFYKLCANSLLHSIMGSLVPVTGSFFNGLERSRALIILRCRQGWSLKHWATQA